MTNAWDMPTYAALTGVSLLLATRRVRGLIPRLGITAAMALAIALIAYVAVIPFSQNYVALYGDIAESRNVSPLINVEAHLGVFFLIVAFGLSFLLSRLWVNAPAIFHPLVCVTALLMLLLARWYAVDQSIKWIEITDDLTVGFVIAWLMVGVLMAARQALDFGLPRWLTPILIVVSSAGVIWFLVDDKVAASLFLGLGSVASLIWLMTRPSAERFVAALIAAAMFVGAGVELVYLVDALESVDWERMNTVFKFYNAIWVMLALASASLVAWMIQGSSEPSPGMAGEPPVPNPDAVAVLYLQNSIEDEADLGSQSTQEPNDAIEEPPTLIPAATDASEATGIDDRRPERIVSRGALSQIWAQAGLIVAGVAIVASLAYPVLATGTRLNQHFDQPGASWTLNALDWMSYGTIAERGNGGVEYSYDEDRAVIEWFNNEVDGSPVIAEASLGQYICGSLRISNHTGLPAVVGWVWHESQQRGWTDLYQRQDEVEKLYTSLDPQEKLALIDKYRVEYIVVGDLERSYPNPDCISSDNSDGIAAFEPLVGSRLEVAFTSGETIVYRVIHP
jgi:uncharacterized membrane protein